MPQISIIVPVYNVEPYLPRCIDSILCQTFGDFDLILVDDSSPDSCGRICDAYARKDSRIHVIHKENGGISSARNAGIDWAFENSGSRWLAFVDSDDWVHPCFLAYLHRAATEQGTMISQCGFVQTPDVYHWPEAPEYRVTGKSSMDVYRKNDVGSIVAWNKLYARDLFQKERYPIGKKHEDSFLTFKLLYHAGTVACLDAPLYVYFRREDSAMGRFTLQGGLDALEAAKEQCAFFQEREKELYREALWRQIYAYTGILPNMRAAPGGEEVYKACRKDFRKLIAEQKKLLGISLFRKRWVYDEAYPGFAKVYLAVRKALGKR